MEIMLIHTLLQRKMKHQPWLFLLHFLPASRMGNTIHKAEKRVLKDLKNSTADIEWSKLSVSIQNDLEMIAAAPRHVRQVWRSLDHPYERAVELATARREQVDAEMAVKDRLESKINGKKWKNLKARDKDALVTIARCKRKTGTYGLMVVPPGEEGLDTLLLERAAEYALGMRTRELALEDVQQEQSWERLLLQLQKDITRDRALARENRTPRKEYVALLAGTAVSLIFAKQGTLEDLCEPAALYLWSSGSIQAGSRSTRALGR
jgi:hypothetical protein